MPEAQPGQEQRMVTDAIDDALSAWEAGTADAAETIEALYDRLILYREALTPSAQTKAAYIGEFSFTIDEQSDDAMCEVSRKVDVPWTTIKQIMAAILDRAVLSRSGG